MTYYDQTAPLTSDPPFVHDQPSQRLHTGSDLQLMKNQFRWAMDGLDATQDDPDTPDEFPPERSDHQDDAGKNIAAEHPELMFESLRLGPERLDSQAEVESPRPSVDNIQRLNDVVAKLLVSDGTYDQKQEVRMMLKADVLAGTEVRIFNEQGITQIAFVTTEVAVYRLLNTKKEEMRRHFERKLSMKLNTEIVLLTPPGACRQNLPESNTNL